MRDIRCRSHPGPPSPVPSRHPRLDQDRADGTPSMDAPRHGARRYAAAASRDLRVSEDEKTRLATSVHALTPAARTAVVAAALWWRSP